MKRRAPARRLRWEVWGTLDGESRRDRGTQCHPNDRWRCRVWVELRDVGHPTLMPVWCWEARRFGRHSLHVSGEAGTEKLCKLIAVAAVDAIVGKGG